MSLKKILILLCLNIVFIESPLAAVIKIGVAGPFTGPHAPLGEQMWQGASLAAKDINAQGGIHGDTIELIKADDVCDPKKAAEVATDLVDHEKVEAVIGHYCSNATIAASKIYANADILMVTPASTSAQVTELGLKTVIRTCGRDDHQGKIAAEFIFNTLKSRRIAIVYDEGAYGKGLATALRVKVEELGPHVVFAQAITPKEKDYNAIITKILALEADTVYFSGMQDNAASLLQALRKKSEIPFVTGDTALSTSFMEKAGGQEALKKVYVTFGGRLDEIPSYKPLVERFKKDGFDPEGYTLYAYEALEVIAEAMREVEGHDGNKLADWIKTHPIDTALGLEDWDSSGDLTKETYQIYVWQDDESKFVPLNYIHKEIR